MRLLLLSTGGDPFLAHARTELTDFLSTCHKIGFVTAASLGNETAYLAKARDTFETLGCTIDHVRWQRPPTTLAKLDAIMAGGGNTWALLQRLSSSGLLPRIRDAVRNGLQYVGASAGSNIAGPNIVTTNDWNVVECRRFRAMGIVPWNINPHYLDGPDPRAPRRETTIERAAEYHGTRENPIVGLEERAIIRVANNRAIVKGEGRVIYIARGEEPQWYHAGSELPYADLVAVRRRRSPARSAV